MPFLTVALTSTWKTTIPASVISKLTRRKQLASERTNRLSSMQSESSFFGDSTNSLGDANVVESGQSNNRRTQHTRRRRRETPRQRRNRRRRERNQSQTSAGYRGAANSDETEAGDRDEESLSYIIGQSILSSEVAQFVGGQDDGCPCCYDRFRVELSETLIVVNSCGHACCIPCTARLWKKSHRGRNSQVAFVCPICRVPFPEAAVTQAVEPLLAVTSELKDRLDDLPVSASERIEVARTLCLQEDFRVAEVLRVLDSMLTDGLQCSLRRTPDLSPEQKQEIYEDARRPVDALMVECKSLMSQRILIRDQESDEYKEINQCINELQRNKIPAARMNAQAQIFERVNSAGTMGFEDDQGHIEVDFHALHVDEALAQFDGQVLPILKAVRGMTIVVGRGKNSEGGVAKLKPALRKHINKHPQRQHLRHYDVEGNKGAIRVEWKNRRL